MTMNSELVKRAAVAAATFGIAGGALFAAGGSASAATLPADAGARAPRVTVYTQGDHENSYGNSDRYGYYGHDGYYDHGHDGWYEYGNGWYRYDHGARYRYDGHRFYHLHHGTWTEWTYAGFHHYAV
jgi:hypothetical protein